MNRPYSPRAWALGWLLALAAVGILLWLLSCGAAAQEAPPLMLTRPGYAACYSAADWHRQERLRSDVRTWYREMERLITAERCWVTTDGWPVLVYASGVEGAVRVRDARAKGEAPLWYLSVEAVRAPG